MSVKDNIRRLRKEAGYTQEQLAEKLDVSRSTVTQWESGWSQPRMGMVQKLAGVFNTTASVIVADDSVVQPSPTEARSLPVYSGGKATIPLVTLGRVHAGPLADEEVVEKQVEIPASVLEHHPNARALVVEGNCMDRVVPDGMVVAYDPDVEPHNGSIAIVETERYESVMRRWYRGGDTLMLVADSHAEHADIVLREEDGPIRVLGTVVWTQSAEEMD